MPCTGNQSHVEYYVTVKPFGSDLSYMVARRFSLFHALKNVVARYQYEIGEQLDADFVDDRIGTFFWGSTEDTYYARQVMLDKWLRTLCLCGAAMTHPIINAAVLEFLCFKDYVSRKPVVIENADAPIQLM
jgi:hypothetical protein